MQESVMSVYSKLMRGKDLSSAQKRKPSFTWQTLAYSFLPLSGHRLSAVGNASPAQNGCFS